VLQREAAAPQATQPGGRLQRGPPSPWSRASSMTDLLGRRRRRAGDLDHAIGNEVPALRPVELLFFRLRSAIGPFGFFTDPLRLELLPFPFGHRRAAGDRQRFFLAAVFFRRVRLSRRLPPSAAAVTGYGRRRRRGLADRERAAAHHCRPLPQPADS